MDGNGFAPGDLELPSRDQEGHRPGQDLKVRGLQRMDMFNPHEAARPETGLKAQDPTAGLPRRPQKPDALAVFGILYDLTAEGH